MEERVKELERSLEITRRDHDAMMMDAVRLAEEKSALTTQLAEAQERIAELEHEKTQCAEALQVVRSGQPLGPIVGAQTIINQQRTIAELKRELEKAKVRSTNLFLPDGT